MWDFFKKIVNFFKKLCRCGNSQQSSMQHNLSSTDKANTIQENLRKRETKFIQDPSSKNTAAYIFDLETGVKSLVNLVKIEEQRADKLKDRLNTALDQKSVLNSELAYTKETNDVLKSERKQLH